PVELGRQHESARVADAHQLAGSARTVDKHGDRLGHHPVEAPVGETEVADVAVLHRDLLAQTGAVNVRSRALQHQRSDVDRRDACTEASGDPDRGGANAATHIEYALVGSKI